MHVPELDKAVAELARVLKPGGVLLIGETNRDAPVIRLRWLYWRLTRRRGAEVEHLSGQTHTWLEDKGNKLFVRQVSLDWMASRFEARGLNRWWTNTGDLTELYVSGRLGGRSFFLWLNSLWFRLGGSPRLAAVFYMAFRKPS